MGLTTKELSYIWVDSFINLSYSQKELLFSVIEDEPKILDAIKRERDLLIDEFGEDKFNTMHQLFTSFMDFAKLKWNKASRIK